MIQQLKFSPVENVLTVLFVVVILGYLLYLLDRSIQNKQRGKHTVSRAKVVSKEQSTAVGYRFKLWSYGRILSGDRRFYN